MRSRNTISAYLSPKYSLNSDTERTESPFRSAEIFERIWALLCQILKILLALDSI